MRSPKLLASGTASINMTPMIDVVFLLIIFFLVSSHMAKQENQIPLKLPLANSGLQDLQQRERIVVSVLPDGKWMMGGAPVSLGDFPQMITARQMLATVPLQLKLRTDQSVPYEQIEPLLRAAAQAGITDVVFSVFEDRRR